mgnify:FL=1
MQVGTYGALEINTMASDVFDDHWHRTVRKYFFDPSALAEKFRATVSIITPNIFCILVFPEKDRSENCRRQSRQNPKPHYEIPARCYRLVHNFASVQHAIRRA